MTDSKDWLGIFFIIYFLVSFIIIIDAVRNPRVAVITGQVVFSKPRVSAGEGLTEVTFRVEGKDHLSTIVFNGAQKFELDHIYRVTYYFNIGDPGSDIIKVEDEIV